MLELLVSDLYLRYSETYPEDRDFWWWMALEEKNHAALLKSGRIYLERGILPEEIIHSSISVLREANIYISALVERAGATTPLPMEEAYREALRIESSAAEIHYQKLMETDSDNKVIAIFKLLGGDDKDHAKRIEVLMALRGILES